MTRSLPWPLTRFLVADHSMQPALAPGDRLLVLARPWCGPLKVGHVVVLRDPEQAGRFLVKRVADVLPGQRYDLRGDASDQSRDSRAFGPAPRTAILGRVVYRYLPAERRGALDTTRQEDAS